ncbi:hypothetical protein [Aeoliella sp. SH292]|uniref:hypothetical protein n=1 Tax=Aeoliella sp. SH292 TaxID=3454464 RepID=UPI003F9D1985
MRRIASACALSILATTLGCNSRPGSVAQIAADPADLARRLMDAADVDKNGALTADEWKQTPYLATAAAECDANKDKKISPEELETRFRTAIFDPTIAVLPGECRVTRNGQPLAGAKVVFRPAPFLVDLIPSADGIVDSSGIARLQMDPNNLPANMPKIAGMIRPGYYLIQVTHDTITIPSKYNAETILGTELSPSTQLEGPIVVALEF